MTMGKATSLLDLKTGNEVWKKKKMIPYCVDAKNRMFLAYKGSYMNGVSNELEGHSLATGEKMWSRKMSHVYGWNESGLLDDSTRLIVSDGIHLVHMGNGEGPSYAMPTGASDYKEAVALGALGVVTGVLTGFAAVPTGPKKVMELVSNVLSDDTVFYVASRENLFCLDRQLQPKWGYPIPDGMGSRSHLFARGDSLYMINMGTGYRNTIFDTSEAYAHEYLRLKVGWPFIACFDKRKGEKVWFRQLSDKKEMVEEFDINWEEDALMVLFSDHIRKYSLSGDSLLSEHKGIHTAGIGRIRQDIPQTGTIQAKTQDCPQIVTVARHGAAALLRCYEMQHRNWLFRPGIRWFNAEHFAFRIRPAALKSGKIAALTVERGLCKGLFAVRKEARCPRDATLHGGTAEFFHPAHQKAFILVLRRHKAAGPCIRRRRHCSPARPAGRP